MKTRTVRPAGFTLVEILMVILIIGMLVTLLSVAAGFAIGAAKRTAIKVDISNLDAAMQGLSTSKLNGEYPPCMAIPANPLAGYTPDRVTQFDRIFRKRYPRSTTGYTAINSMLQGVTVVIPSWTGWFSRAGDLQSGAAIKLSLDTMDPAEALVFWLAGPPTPFDPATNAPMTNTILYGFCGNATTPFAPKGSRESSLYGFDETRLTDADSDGWPEYIPKGITKKVTVAPYVYFDAASYTYASTGPSSKTYVACYPGIGFQIAPSVVAPVSNPLTPLDTQMVNNWGFVAPYSDGSTAPFWNPKKFQIICAGLDSEYGAAPSDSVATVRPGVVLVPKSGSSSVPTLLEGDWDNLVNFIDTVLEDQTGQ